MNARHCVWETSVGLFLCWSWEDWSCELRRAGISCCYGYHGSLLCLRAGWLLTGSPFRPPSAPPLTVCSCWCSPPAPCAGWPGEEGQGALSLSVLGGPWALEMCISHRGSVIGSYWSSHPLVSAAAGPASKLPAVNVVSGRRWFSQWLVDWCSPGREWVR